MDVSLLIKQRLTELRLDQRDLAAAAQVTESYISQLLARKKAPPEPGRTDIYEKIGRFLGLGDGELSRLAEVQRREEFKKKIAKPPGPLFKELRELVLRKCAKEARAEARRIFEKEAFGEFERLVTQKILDVAQSLAREQLRNEEWIRAMAQASGRSPARMRAALREFLDSDVFHVSIGSCASLLDPMIVWWTVDMRTFAIEIGLNPRLSPCTSKRFEFMEAPAPKTPSAEPGFEQFLNDKTMSGDATEAELEFLRRLEFKQERPSALYYYRELQSLRDPLHFPRPNGAGSGQETTHERIIQGAQGRLRRKSPSPQVRNRHIHD